ncbi:peptidase S8/S53 domain-containing protein, partial [Catenaria anguillulae PL171]
EQQAPVPSWGLARISSRARPGNYSRQPFTYPASAGQGVAIYIFDTGINIAHKDFNGRSEHGTATCTPRCHPTADIDGHGTHVAGTACGTKFGVAKRARCISVKALDDGGQSRTEELLKGIEWIVNRVQRRPNERAVVNMSITTGDDKALDGAILTMAYEFGVVVVVAGGNGGMSACFKSPAKIGHFGTPVITVGASDEVDALTMFSNYGPCVSILAPGTNIISAAGNSTTGSVFMTGTSMSTPHVSGAAALLLSDNPKLTPMEVKERLIDFATPDIVSDAVYETPNKLLFVGQG